MFTGAQRWKNGIGALVTQEKKSEKKLLLRNINATSNTQMKGEYDCNTLHPPHIIWKLRAVSLMLWRWLSWVVMQILPQTLSKRVECIFRQKTLPSPSEKKHTHMDTHIHTYRTTESKTKHLNFSAYTSINQGADDKTYKHVLHWTENEFLL